MNAYHQQILDTLLTILNHFYREEAFIKYKSRIEFTLAVTLSEYGICPKDVTERIQKAIMEITAVEVYTEEDGIKHDVLNFGKMRNKFNYGHREKTKADMLKDLSIFTISCGLFLSFVILIWNYDSENLDFGTPSYNFVVSIFIVITIFMILWKTRK